MNRAHTIAPAHASGIIARFIQLFLPFTLLVLVLIFSAYHALQKVQNGQLATQEKVFVLQNGYTRTGQHFQELFPEAWKAISGQRSGQYSDSHGIFSFDTLSLDSASQDISLKVVAYNSAEDARVRTRRTVFSFSALASILLLLLAAGAWSMARSQTDYEIANVELRDAHAELTRKNAQLAHINASKDKFFSILAQDLQTPITRALELVQFTSENLDFFGQAEYRETTDTLLSSLENLRELLKNLFTWSGIQQGTLMPHLQTVDLGEIVKRNTSILLPVAEDKQIIFKNSVPGGTFIYADPDMVYAVVRNLITNALKFSFPDDSVSIASVPHDETIELIISDSGVGIDAENLPKLFHDDVKYQTPGTSGEEGAGLGLLLCKQLMDKNRGTIRIESIAGQGTRVLCRFLRKQA